MEMDMKVIEKKPAREFEVGFEYKRIIKDCGSVEMEADEQLTFTTESGGEYDVTRKDWGFYMGPSLNGRLSSYNLCSVLVKNRVNHFFMLLAEAGFEESFQKYLKEEQLSVVCWMHRDVDLEELEKKLK